MHVVFGTGQVGSTLVDRLLARGLRVRSVRRSAEKSRHAAHEAVQADVYDRDAAIRAACEAFATAPPTPHKSGRRGAVWLTPELAIKDRDAGAARKLWRAAYWLDFAGVDAPAPVALRLLGGRGLVFSRRAGQRSLADELAAAAPTSAAVLRDARQLGNSIGRLHAHGLGNRDL